MTVIMRDGEVVPQDQFQSSSMTAEEKKKKKKVN